MLPVAACKILALQELMEKDREDAKEKAMQGKEVTFDFFEFRNWNFFQVTTGEKIVKDGETVDQFIKRVWK